MTCQRTTITTSDGKKVTAIVCGPRRQKRKLCGCGSGMLAGLLCDWKVPGKPTGTCDAPICSKCTHSPAPDKDLCPAHATEWKARQGLTG